MITKKIKSLRRNAGFIKYFNNTAYLLTDKIFNLIVAFFVSVYLARHLGPSNYGILTFAQSVIAFLSVFASFGIKDIIVRNLVIEDNRYSSVIMGTSLLIRIISSTLGIFFILHLSHFIAESNEERIVILILSFTTLFESFEIIKFFFQSKIMADKVLPVAIIQTATGALLKIFLIQLNVSLVWFATVYVFELLVAAGGLVFIYKKQGHKILSWKFDALYAKRLIKDSWPLLFSGFVIVIYMKIDQIMIKYMLSDFAVGVYAISVKLTSVWYFVGVVICNSLMPALVRAKEYNKKLYYQRQQYLYELMIGIGIFLAIPITFFAYPLINWLFGNEYSAASSVLTIQIWSLIFIFLGIASSNWLITENLQKYNLSRTILGALVNVILNVLLIPDLGIQGAALATLISQVFASYLANLISKKTFIVFKMQSKAFLFGSTLKHLKTSFS